MAGVWCLHRHWRQNGYRHVADQDLVRLYFFSYHGLAADHLFYPRLLDEYQKIYFIGQEKSPEISLTTYLPGSASRFFVVTFRKSLFFVPV
jgi:hypothetical protein